MDKIWPKNQIKLENAWKFVTGCVEELLVAEELWNDHNKPFSSAATSTNRPLEVDQSTPVSI
ncbi:hypothetical protein Taro_005412 [Colocasia esculenta]|uniref:Uncharacterized protein n=1 Tax=Colocasia esculenta TaxID=4460 RepID=A0A843TN16_COLES|nr:hypothetical protein [Colocasia esculenta]